MLTIDWCFERGEGDTGIIQIQQGRECLQQTNLKVSNVSLKTLQDLVWAVLGKIEQYDEYGDEKPFKTPNSKVKDKKPCR